MQIDLTIIHDQGKWKVWNTDIRVSADTLEELDHKIKNVLQNDETIPKGKKIRLFMAFDHSTIPQWIRQYSQHYFNRIVEFEF